MISFAVLDKTCKSRNLSDIDLAMLLNVTSPMVSRYRRGKAIMPPKKWEASVKRVAAVLKDVSGRGKHNDFIRLRPGLRRSVLHESLTRLYPDLEQKDLLR